MVHSPFYLNFDDDVDRIWKICLIIGVCITCIAISTLIRILQHFHCNSQSSYHSKLEPRYLKIYSTLSVTFAFISALVTLSMYPVCQQFPCWGTTLGWFYGLLFWSSYTIAKCSLYAIFIGRLFNPHYRNIYPYPINIQYFLWILLIVLVVTMIEFNFHCVLKVGGIERIGPPQYIDIVFTAMYGIADCVLSLFCTVLFFQPICSPLGKDSVYMKVYMSVVKKYGFISCLQLVAAISFQLSSMARIYLSTIDISQNVWNGYNYIIRVIQMLDCLLLMICIYVGFVLKKTVCLRNIFD